MTVLQTPKLEIRQKALAHLIGKSLLQDKPFVNYRTAVGANMVFSPKPAVYKKIRQEYENALFPGEFSDKNQTSYDDLFYHQFLIQVAINVARSIFNACVNTVMAAQESNAYTPSARAAAQSFRAKPSVKTMVAMLAADDNRNLANQEIERVLAVSKDSISNGLLDEATEQVLKKKQYTFRILKERLAIYFAPSEKADSYSMDMSKADLPLGSGIGYSRSGSKDQITEAMISEIEKQAAAFYEFLVKGSSDLASAPRTVTYVHKSDWNIAEGFGASSILSSVSMLLPSIDKLFKLLEKSTKSIASSDNAPYWYFGLTRGEDRVIANKFAVDRKSDESKAPSMASLLKPNFRVTLVNVISLDLARYITQTPEGTISYSTFANWFQQYLHYYWELYDAESVPTYVIPINKMDELYGDNSQFAGAGRPRLNEDNMFIDGDGDISYMPHVDAETTKRYMQIVDELMTLSYKEGGPLSMDRTTEDVGIRNRRPPEETERINNLKAELKSLSALPVALNWNIGAALLPFSENPTATNTINLMGAKPLDVRSTADLLSKTPREFLQYMTGVSDVDENSDLFTLIKTATYLYQMAATIKGTKLPSLQSLWDSAVKESGFEKKIKDKRFYESLYLSTVFGSSNLPKWGAATSDSMEMKEIASRMATAVMGALTLAGSRSRLAPIATAQEYKIDEAPFYYPEILYQPIAQIHDIAEHYLSVDVMFRMFAALSAAFVANNKLLFELSSSPEYQNSSRELVLSSQILTHIMPSIHVFGKYIPSYKDIKAKAQAAEIACALRPEDKIRTMEQAMSMAPGFMGAKGMAMFPHQVEVHRRLERVVDELMKTSSSNDVLAAILDIDPGGGKTTSVLADAVNMMSKGLSKHPIVIPPTPLVKNWKDDLDKFTEAGYNIVTITSKLMNAWGPARIKALICNLPANSILVVAIDWLSRWTPPKKENEPKDDGRVLFGTSEVKTFPAVTQMLRFYAPDYIGIDESHFVKNPAAERHQAVQALVSLPSVRFLRLASGTVVTDKPTDLVGQVKLINPYVFGSARDFEKAYMDDSRSSWKPGAAQDIRSRLNKFMPVLTYKRSEWAFMLPYPEENIRQVKLPDSPDYRDLYQMMYKETIEEIRTTNPRLYKLLTDGDESNAAEIEAALQNIFQKLEQFLIAPEIMLKDRAPGPDTEKLKARIAKLPLSPKIIDPNNGILAILKEHFAKDRRAKANKLADKVMIFCRYKISVAKIYASLPPEIKKIALTLTGDDQSALKPFNDPLSPYQVLICTEQTVNTGKNLQIASRIIRVELPWSPGEQDQAMARVMRPTPPTYDPKTKKFKEHTFKRQRIYMDTVIVESTLEIAKIARLISKIAIKSKFDHYGKPDYDALPELPIIRMSLDSFETFQTLADIGGTASGKAVANSYLDVYQRVKVNELSEFEHKRKTQLTDMIPVKPLPLPVNSVKIPIEMPAMTVDGVPNTPPAKSIIDILDKTYEAARKSVKGFTLKVEKPKKRLGQVIDEQKEEETPKKTVTVKKVGNTEVKTKLNKEGKPVKTQVVSPRDKSKMYDEPNTALDQKVVVDVTAVNGMIAVSITDTDDADLDAAINAVAGFKKVGRSVYTWIPNVPRLKSVLSSLQTHFEMKSADVKSIQQFEKSFVNGKKFSAKRSTGLDIRNFYLENHKTNPDKKSLRIYPVVHDGELYLMADAARQASGRLLIAKRKLSGSPAVWEAWDPVYIKFAKDKNELIRVLKAIKKVVGIQNEKDITRQVSKMVIGTPTSSKLKTGK